VLCWPYGTILRRSHTNTVERDPSTVSTLQDKGRPDGAHPDFLMEYQLFLSSIRNSAEFVKFCLRQATQERDDTGR
jgi:hypothetical protein